MGGARKRNRRDPWRTSVRITKMTDYALRLLMYVAQRPERLCTIVEVARVHGISEPHLMKVAHRLGVRGWLVTVRGKGGGVRLACEPEAIVLGRVVRDIEPDFELVECFGTATRCNLSGQCRLAEVLGGALQSFLAHLDAYTLADLLVPAALPALADAAGIPIHIAD